MFTFPVLIGEGDLRLNDVCIENGGLGVRVLRNGVALFCLGPNNGVDGVDDFLSNLDLAKLTDPVFAEEKIPREFCCGFTVVIPYLLLSAKRSTDLAFSQTLNLV